MHLDQPLAGLQVSVEASKQHVRPHTIGWLGYKQCLGVATVVSWWLHDGPPELDQHTNHGMLVKVE